MEILATSLRASANIARAKHLQVCSPWILVLILLAIGPVTAVAWADLAITTTPGPTVTLGTGQPVTDSATLTGGITQSGGVEGLDGLLSFVLASPATGVVYSKLVSTNGASDRPPKRDS